MSEELIQSDPAVMMGKPVVAGTRVTVELKRADGATLDIRKATRPEPRQQVIYGALGIADKPGETEKTVIE